MISCGNCNGTLGMIDLNDDGITYTIHLHENDKSLDVKVDFDTLKKLGSAIQIQMFMADTLKYEPIKDIEYEED